MVNLRRRNHVLHASGPISLSEEIVAIFGVVMSAVVFQIRSFPTDGVGRSRVRALNGRNLGAFGLFRNRGVFLEMVAPAGPRVSERATKL